MKLFEFQEAVLNKTEKFNHVGYFLDMGLGKTFVGGEKLWQLNTQVNLLICQKSKVDDWIEHFERYYADDYTICDLTKKKGIQVFDEVIKSGCDVIGVINYDLVFRRSYIGHITGFTLMLDESQIIQNQGAKRSKFVLKMKPENVILLSGTPTSGKYERLWSQVKLLGWDISEKAYFNTFMETEWIENNASGFKRQVVVGYKNVERLKRKLAEHGAIFMKTEEAFDLPEQKEINISVPASEEYKYFIKNSYIDLDLINLCKFFDDSDYQGNDVTPHKELVGDTALVKMLYARQLCGQYSKDKIQAFEDLIESTAERLIVFYNYYEELGAMVRIAGKLERPISIVNGQLKDLTAYEEQDDSITFVQYQAGATGLNLQKANKMIYFTLPLGKGSCATWEQSKKRIHRIGQEKPCFYYYLLCKGSLEEQNLINLRLGKEYNDKLFEKEYC